MKILVYSFRTFPFLKDLENSFGEIVVLGKLNTDLEKLKEIIVRDKPDIILGIAAAKNSSSQESTAINKFHGTKLINKSGVYTYPLNILNIDIKLRKTTTDSFCNWTMYKISEYILENNLKCKNSFIHISPKDLDLLKSISSLQK